MPRYNKALIIAAVLLCYCRYNQAEQEADVDRQGTDVEFLESLTSNLLTIRDKFERLQTKLTKLEEENSEIAADLERYIYNPILRIIFMERYVYDWREVASLLYRATDASMLYAQTLENWNQTHCTSEDCSDNTSTGDY